MSCPGEPQDPATCGTCGLTWDDAVVTSTPPAPSGRCPFEPFHVEEDEQRLHTHRYAGQVLTHRHEWTGDHGYFEHPEDGAGRTAEPAPTMRATVHARTTRFAPDDEGTYGMQATAKLRFEQADGTSIVQTISSPGLWGLAEQEDAAYLSEVEAEQNGILDGMLAALGLTGSTRRCVDCGNDDTDPVYRPFTGGRCAPCTTGRQAVRLDSGGEL